MPAKVYFTRELTPEKVVELYRALDVELPGKVAVKVHSGEKGNQNFLRPEFWRPMVEAVQRHHRGVQHRLRRRHRRRAGQHRIPPQAHRGARLERVLPRGPAWTPRAPMWCGPSPTGKCLKENHCGQEHPPLRFHAGAGPLQGPSHGRLRRGAEAALHRLRLPRRARR